MRHRLIALVALIAAFAFAGGATPRAAQAAASMQTINIVASDFKFAPGKITLEAGKPVKLSFTSTQGVHAVGSSDLGISKTMIMPGKTVVVTITPTKVGTYTLHCEMFCGAGHADMKLTVVVAK